MNTTILFNVDKKIKAAAMKKAIKQGVTLTAVLNTALKTYIKAKPAEGEDILARDIARAMEQYHAGLGISGEELRRRLGI